MSTIQPTGNTLQSTPATNEKTTREAPPAAAVKPSVAPVVSPPTAVQPPEPAPPDEKVTEALRSINKSMESMSRDLEFIVDESDRTIVKVIDPETKEIIRQMPSKEALEIANALDKVQGLLISQTA